jgi:DNA-binding XRE family transcriptional regulator/DNA-binding Xre family transcriptional regulator
MASTPIISLRGAKALRISAARDINAKQMSRLTGISLQRLTLLESLNVHKAEEPWLAEAYAICRALRCDLMTAIGGTVDRLADIDTGYDLQDPIDVWRTGVPLPLRYGIRMAVRFGLDDPFELYRCRPQLEKQIMEVFLAGERTSGICPWCIQPLVGAAGHLDTCLPAILYQPRDAHMVTIGTAPKPWKPHVARGGSKFAPGLLAVRERAGVTQEVFAGSIGIAGTTYYRLEKMRDRLTITLATRISSIYKVTLADLYGS